MTTTRVLGEMLCELRPHVIASEPKKKNGAHVESGGVAPTQVCSPTKGDTKESVMVKPKQKITTFLWFDGHAEQAAELYTSLFPDSRIVDVSRYGEGGPGKPGSVMSVTFELAGQQFFALNGGPHYQFTPAVSLYVSCQTQEEVDRLWAKLLEGGGKETACGWLDDRFGLSWQIIPDVLPKLLSDPDRGRAGRAMQAMLKMKKLDIAGLNAAADAAS